MRKILIVYGTTEGQTAKIASAIRDTLHHDGTHVDVSKAGPEAPVADGYDGVIVAASVHGGRYQKPVYRWATANASALNSRPTAFVSVCLGVLQKEPKVQREVAAIATRFLDEVTWTPTVVKTVAGALLYTRYNILVRWVMKRIARKAGGDTDTSRDYEYTDWNDVRAFAHDFGRRVAEPPVDRAAADAA